MSSKKYRIINAKYKKAEEELNKLSRVEIIKAWDAVSYGSITIILSYRKEVKDE